MLLCKFCRRHILRRQSYTTKHHHSLWPKSLPFPASPPFFVDTEALWPKQPPKLAEAASLCWPMQPGGADGVATQKPLVLEPKLLKRASGCERGP